MWILISSLLMKPATRLKTRMFQILKKWYMHSVPIRVNVVCQCCFKSYVHLSENIQIISLTTS